MQCDEAFGTDTAELVALGDWLISQSVRPGWVWSPPGCIGSRCSTCSRRTGPVAGQRPRCQTFAGSTQTDVLDAVWLCKVAERQMLRPSFVPPWPIRRLRDLTRYRTDLVAARTAEKNRVEKLLVDACIKLSVVASDIFGVSGRAMLAALVAGERDPKVLAQLARARMRGKIDRLEQAFDGHFAEHHRFLLSRMLSRIEGLDADIAAVDAQIETQLAPFAEAAAHLDEIPGIGPIAAAAIIAEIGSICRGSRPRGLCSWAKFAPGINSSAGKTKGSASSGHGNPYLARVLGEAAVGTTKTNTFLAPRYRRIARRRGQPRAVVAIGRSILVIIWHLLHDPQARYHDLGADHYTRHVDPLPRSAVTFDNSKPSDTRSHSLPPPNQVVRTDANSPHFRISGQGTQGAPGGHSQ